jgi:hypothetical protein
MGALKTVLFAVLFLAIANTSAGFSLESDKIEFYIVDDNVLVQNILVFSEDSRGILSLSIPADAQTIEVYLNGIKTDANITDNHVLVDLQGINEIRLSFITEEFVDNDNFLFNTAAEYDANLLEITVALPEEAVLKRPIKDAAGSVYPRPDKATTDGRSLIFTWERKDVKAGDEAAIFVMYKTKANHVWLIVILVFVVFSLTGYVFYKKPAKKEKTKKKEKEPKVLKYLKEDEQQIVRILKQRKGKCEQGTMRVITGFSKASLSRLLSELEARKIVYKEKKGKKNLIFLK